MQRALFSLHRSARWLSLLVCACLLTAPAHADPAGRIGRLAWLSGELTLFNPSSGESYSASRNQPLTSGDILTTAATSRAEIQIGSLTVRLDGGSRLDLARIDDEQIQLYLDTGRAIVKLPAREALRDFELATRNGRFSARDTGIYRFDADSGSTLATAYYGALHFAASDSTLDFGAGQSAQFWFSGQTRYRLSNALSDEFSQWSAQRDQRTPATTDAPYARYVSPEMTGAEDLDAYGNWSESAEYGAIWTPRAVAADWAPYRSGHWVWVAPWGWNWVGDEPWGFAPFHYGRWVQHRGTWGWVPGARIERPVYAPALVAWRRRPGISVAISSRPTSGWFPLAPREVYVPIYRSSENYVRRVNVPHVGHLDNAGEIARHPQAVIEQGRYAHRYGDRDSPPAAVRTEAIEHGRHPESTRFSPDENRAARDQTPNHPAAQQPADTRRWPEHRPAPPRQEPALNVPAPVGRNANPPQAPSSATWRDQAPALERVRPAAPRPESSDARPPERFPRRAEAAAVEIRAQQSRQVPRVETAPPVAHEARHEAPREAARANEARSAPRAPEERQRPPQGEQDKRRRDGGERR